MILNYIKKYEKYSIITSILMIILSIFLIVKPVKSIEIFVVMFSSIMFINGFISLISYFTTPVNSRLFSFDFINGIFTILISVLTFIYRNSLINFFPIIIGAWIIMSNLIKLQLSINLSGIKNSGWIFLVIISIITIILGLVIVVNPFESLIVITLLTGILLLTSEVINLIESICILINIRNLK